MIYLYSIKALTESTYSFELQREVTVGASHKGWNMFVASEPGGRKQFC